MCIWNYCRIFASEKGTNNKLNPKTRKGTEIMTKQEFTQRTKVEVSNNEFEMINEFYMNCECDKDEFCKMWVKMNPSRVKEAKVEKMLKAKDEAYRDALHKFYHKFDNNNETFSTPICYVNISVYEVQAMSHAGIKVANENGRCKYLSDVRYEIGHYLGMF